MAKDIKYIRRSRVKQHVRKRINGTPERPRLTVYKSNQRIYATIVDDIANKVITSVSSVSVMEKDRKNCNIENSKKTGELIGKKAKEKGISQVVFDRSCYVYHGKVKALAEGAREVGLVF